MSDDDLLNSPEMLDWIECQETAVAVMRDAFVGVPPGMPPETAERVARGLLARLAANDPSIIVAWNRD